MNEKPKFPRAEADAVAQEIRDRLAPFCEEIVVAGSIRRERPFVGDVEIVYISKTEVRPFDFFETEAVAVAEEELGRMLADGTIAKRLSVKGIASWGDKNKLAVHRSGIPVDLFRASRENWANYLVCRTGPGALNVRIAEAANRKGFKWNPYGGGFTDMRGGRVVAMDSEKAVFDFVGIPYTEPRHR